MFGKLIKHEFKAMGRVLLPIVAALLLVSVLANFAIDVLDNSDSGIVANALSGLIVGAWVLALIALSTVVTVVIVLRFYRSVLCPEGYLTMTLPVSTEEVIFSKIIASVVWFIIAGFAIFLSLSFGLVNVDEIKTAFTGNWKEAFAALKSSGGLGNVILFLAEILLLIAVSSGVKILHFYLAMAIGQCADNGKVFKMILAYFGINIVMTVFTVKLIPAVGNLFENIGKSALFSSSGEMLNSGAVHSVMLLAILLSAVVGAVYFLPTDKLIKKKLNI